MRRKNIAFLYPDIIGGKINLALIARLLGGALCLLLVASQTASAQSKKELEERRRKLLKEIQVTDKLLKKTLQSKEAAYDRFVALQNQIQSRENLINTIDAEITAAEESIRRNTSVVESLNRDIELMKTEYGQMVRNAFRRRTLSNPLLYILSAESLNQAFRRWLFLRKYDRFRKGQAEAIRATMKILADKVANLEQTRAEKENLLISLQGQRATLAGELKNKDQLLQNLGKDEVRLKTELDQKQVAHEKLNQMIENVIQEEVRKRVEEARRARPAPPTAAAPKTKENTAPPQEKKEDANASAIPEDAISQSFRKKRGDLPWPVDDGFITRSFGRQKHPTIRNIEITNNGIDIRTDESARVYAVFEGRVAGVQFIPGHNYTVIIQHGDYYTVYSNLSETGLSKGDFVKAKQSVGRVSANAITGTTELHFELWRQKERMNPAQWIRK